MLNMLSLAASAEQNIQALRSVKVISTDEVGAPLRFPSGITYDRDADEIYVTSPQRNKLVVMTPDYFPYLSLGAGRGLNSISKSFIKDGLLYVCLGASEVEMRPHIAVLDMAFMPVKQIFFPDFEFFSPLGVAVGLNGNIYVVGMNGTGVMVLNSAGDFLRWIEPKDEVLEVMEKAPILGLDVGSDGRLYFLSEAMGRVFVYSSDEKFLYKFGEKGGEPGKLSRPRGIAVDDVRQQVYLVDYQRHTMSVYAMTGEYLFEVGGMGGGRGWFYYPSDLIVDGQGRIIVADTFNHRLQVFEFISERGYGSKRRAAGQKNADAAESAADSTMVDESQTVGEAQAVAAPGIAEVIRIRSLKQPIQIDLPGDFLVVTGLARQQADAAEQQLQLSRKGYPARIASLDKGKSGLWYQVFVGPYVDPLKAHEVAKRIRAEEKLPAILKTRGKPLELELTKVETPLPERETAKLGESEESEGSEEVNFVEAITLPEYQIPTIETLEQPAEKIFPAVELFDRIKVLPKDDIHAPLEQMIKPMLKPATPAPQEAPPQSKHEPSPAAQKSRVVAAKPKLKKKLVPTVAPLAVAQVAVDKKVNSCMVCHDKQLAMFCQQCHSGERDTRVAVGL